MKSRNDTMKILALIPARSGSKRIPNKNIIYLGHHPLIAYSIVTAKMSKHINRIITTTDCKKIAEIAQSYGSEVPFFRPKKISSASSLDIEFFKHALSWLKENEGYSPDLVIHLRPTTPLRDYKIVDKAIQKIVEDKKATSLRSGHTAEETPYKLFKVKDGYLNFFGKNEFAPDEEYYNYPQQKFPKTYVPNGYVDIIKPDVIKETGKLHGKKILAFITKKIPDIDEMNDLEFANSILNRSEYSQLLNELKRLKSD